MPAIQRTLLDGDTGAKLDSSEILAGGIVGGAAGGIIQSAYVQPLAPGEAFDVVGAGHVDLPDGTGTATRMQVLLPNAVQPGSTFRVRFAMRAFPTAVAASPAVELSWRARLFAPDDPNFPVNYNAFAGDVGQLLGAQTFISADVERSGVITQAMIATITVGNGPVSGRLGMWMQVALQNGAPGDVARVNLFPGTGAQPVYLGIEEWGPALTAA